MSILEHGQNCTGFFDGSWGGCCKLHDDLYMTPKGAGMSREDADKVLFECVAKKSKAIAYVMYWAVRMFGGTYWDEYQEQREVI